MNQPFNAFALTKKALYPSFTLKFVNFAVLFPALP